MNFFENNSKLEPHKILLNFIKNNPSIKTAVDLGCGAGRDTKFLVQNDIIVTAIDRVNVTKFLYKDLTEEEKARLNFVQAKFSDVHLPKTDLVISYEALPFCNREELIKLIIKIKESLNENGYFLCNFFGKNDSWYGNDKIQFSELLQSIASQSSIYLVSINPTLLKDIPIPSRIQIEKDIRRESFLINGEEVFGLNWYAQNPSLKLSKHVIHQLIVSMLDSSKDQSPSIESIYEIVLQQLCRTRIGEYCLNELSRSYKNSDN